MPRRTTTGTTSSNEALYAFDTAKRAEHGTVCGVDEAGRGPLCGPVCCAAVILNPDDPIEGVNDSKKLTEEQKVLLKAKPSPSERRVRNMLVADKKDWQYTQSARILQLAISDLGKAWNNFFDKAQPGWGKPKFRSKREARQGFKSD